MDVNATPLAILRKVCVNAGYDIAKAYYDYRKETANPNTLDNFIELLRRDAWNALYEIRDADEQDADNEQ